MELQEQIDNLKNEIVNLKAIIDNLNAEKIALDQSFVSSLKEILNFRKEILLKDTAINQLNTQIQGHLKEKNDLHKSIIELRAELDSLKLGNNSGTDAPIEI